MAFDSMSVNLIFKGEVMHPFFTKRPHTPTLPISSRTKSEAPDINGVGTPECLSVGDGQMVTRTDASEGFSDAVRLQLESTRTRDLGDPSSQANRPPNHPGNGESERVFCREPGQSSVSLDSGDRKGNPTVRMVLQKMGPNLPSRKRRKVTPNGRDSSSTGLSAQASGDRIEGVGGETLDEGLRCSVQLQQEAALQGVSSHRAAAASTSLDTSENSPETRMIHAQADTPPSRSVSAAPVELSEAFSSKASHGFELSSGPNLAPSGSGMPDPATSGSAISSGSNGALGSTPGKKEPSQPLVRIFRVKPQLVFVVKYKDRPKLERLISGCSGTASAESTDHMPSVRSDSAPSSKPVHPFFLGKTSVRPVSQKASGREEAGTASSLDLHSTESESDRAKTDPAQASKTACGSTDQTLANSAINANEVGLKQFSSCRPTRQAGARAPPWPPKDMFHVRPEEAALEEANWMSDFPREQQRPMKKQKHNPVRIFEEESVLRRFSGRAACAREARISCEASLDTDYCALPPPPELRLPERLVLRGSQLQYLVGQELHLLPPGQDPHVVITSGDQSTERSPETMHPGLRRVYGHIGSSVTAFDNASCETQQWVSKYAPAMAEECLQDGSEVTALRDWLGNWALAVNVSEPVRGGPESKDSSNEAGPNDGRAGKKPRARRNRLHDEEMSNFIVPDEEEREEKHGFMELDTNSNYPVDARSLIRGNAMGSPSGSNGERPMNAVLLSGPCGCGKSAAAYAVAKELGFSVFEINSGSRRSGKDLLEKVGDMSTNHLVHRSKDDLADKPSGINKESNSSDGPPSEQGFKSRSIGSFFGRKEVRSNGPGLEEASGSPASGPMAAASITRSERALRKDSVILLEEVDVLFEEDKQFWSTVLGLLLHSKRPVIMTCNDEHLVPIDSLSVHAILRFKPPPVTLAVDYLFLVAAAEGHLLRRDALEALYKAKGHDLRASLMELNFWCQMAVGDQKNGLEWMDDERRLPGGQDGTDPWRTVSKDSYVTGMGWSNRDSLVAHANDVRAVEETLVADAWNKWGIAVGDWHDRGALTQLPANEMLSTADSPSLKGTSLDVWSRFHDALSNADLVPGHALASDHQISLDASQPPLSDKTLLDTVQGYSLLDTTTSVCHSDLSTQLALYSGLASKRVLQAALKPPSNDDQPYFRRISENDFIRLVANHHEQSINQRLDRSDFSNAFYPISEPAGASLTTAASSAFDRPFRLLAEDLAPYVRVIVRSDQHVLEERRRLEEVMSDGGRRTGKRMRMTRASRSALEGGDRASMRREKWLDADLDHALVLRTGSESWSRAVAEYGFVEPL